MHSQRTLFGLAAALAVAASPAQPEDGEAVVVLKGHISARCDIQAPSSWTIGQLALPKGQTTLAVQASCNSPFIYKIQSANGGLKLGQDSILHAPFIARVPYTIGGRSEGRIVFAPCSAEHMQVKACSGSSDAAMAHNQPIILELVWDFTGGQLAAGTYEDVVTLTLAPQL